MLSSGLELLAQLVGYKEGLLKPVSVRRHPSVKKSNSL